MQKPFGCEKGRVLNGVEVGFERLKAGSLLVDLVIEEGRANDAGVGVVVVQLAQGELLLDLDGLHHPALGGEKNTVRQLTGDLRVYIHVGD